MPEITAAIAAAAAAAAAGATWYQASTGTN